MFGYYYPPVTFVGQANCTDPSIYERFSIENFPKCYEEMAALLSWDKYWHTTFDSTNAPFWKWFVGGRLNGCYNCVDRHLKKFKNKVALYFIPEPEKENIRAITYQQLYRRVNEFASVLKDFAGVKPGDRVILYLPMSPEVVISMLACARIGAIHSQVFAGYSGKVCGDRIWDCDASVVVTMDCYYRNGKLIDLKKKTDEAIKCAKSFGKKVKKVLVWQRHFNDYLSSSPLLEGRDFLINELNQFFGKMISPFSMRSEDPLFIIYTSGSGGRPVGCVHATGGYLSYVAWMSKYVLDIKPGDVYWCLSDVGWITGHSFIVYGPLSIGATVVLYEGHPSYPDYGRPWRICEELDVNIFHTTPSFIRLFRKHSPQEPEKYGYSFKLIASVGEPIEPEVWKWCYEVIGKKQAVIVDCWWLTESGGFLCGTMPAIMPMKPGFVGPGLPGIHPVILDDQGKEISAQNTRRAGNLCIKNPWPGIMKTIWKNDELYVSAYYGKFCKDTKSKDWKDWTFFSGDAATITEDGYIQVIGRVDDIINIAGHRMGTKEIEAAIFSGVKEVAEAAVVGAKDEVKGMVPHVYVALKPGYDPSEDMIYKIKKAVTDALGAIARPEKVFIVPELPKTRSGKVLRRVLNSISNNEEIGDTTSLINPHIVEEIRKMLMESF